MIDAYEMRMTRSQVERSRQCSLNKLGHMLVIVVLAHPNSRLSNGLTYEPQRSSSRPALTYHLSLSNCQSSVAPHD